MQQQEGDTQRLGTPEAQSFPQKDHAHRECIKYSQVGPLARKHKQLTRKKYNCFKVISEFHKTNPAFILDCFGDSLCQD